METKKFTIDAIRLIDAYEPRTAPLLGYQQMIAYMNQTAEDRGRKLLDDIFRIISIYLIHGANIDKIIERPSIPQEVRNKIISLKSVYGLSNSSTEHSPTLSRVSEAFPHVTLVMADMLNSAHGKSCLRICVSTQDLGADVNFHFKMNYFPCLIDTDAGWKAQIALLVHNLCHSKSILKTGGVKEIGAAFAVSCKITAKMRKMRLAPADARHKFTEFILDSFNFNAESLSQLWSYIIGDAVIFLGPTVVTPFHELVLGEQPLYLYKWRSLLKRLNIS